MMNTMLTRADCLKLYGSDYLIGKRLQSKELFLVEKGVYSYTQIVPEQAVISFKYPFAIFTMLTAFYFYGLTDTAPEKYDLATDRDAAKINDPRVKQVFEHANFLNAGVVEEKVSGYPIRIYNRERMLIELLRKKSTISYDIYKEIIRNYRNIVDSLDMFKLEEYASLSPKSKKITKALAEEVM